MHLSAVFITVAVYCTLNVQATGDRERLVKDLLKDYTQILSPGKIALKLNVALLCSRYNKETHELTSVGWENYDWNDSRLRWSPSEYGGVESINLPSHVIWTPDVRLFSPVHTDVERPPTNVLVRSDGGIFWVPPTTYVTLCETLENDDLDCRISLGSWTYDALTIDLQKKGDGVELDYYAKDCPLKIADHNATIATLYYPCCKEPYATLDMDFTFKQHSAPAATHEAPALKAEQVPHHD